MISYTSNTPKTKDASLHPSKEINITSKKLLIKNKPINLSGNLYPKNSVNLNLKKAMTSMPETSSLVTISLTMAFKSKLNQNNKFKEEDS